MTQEPTLPPAKTEAPDANVELRETVSAVFLWALGFGAALVGLSLLCNFFNLTSFAGVNLILATGIGILLFAFGTRAILRISYLVMTGAGAIAAAAFVGLMYYSLNDYVEIAIRNKALAHAQVSAGARSSFLGEHDGERYTFIVLRNELTQDDFELDITELDAQNKPLPGGEHVFSCIPSDVFKKYLGRGKTLEWQVDSGLSVLTMKEAPGVRYRDDPVACGDTGPSPRAMNGFFVGAAFAQAAPSPPPSADEIIQIFQSDSAQTRRNSRYRLSEAGLNAVAPLFAAMRTTPDSRVQVGGAVALAAYMRDNKDQAKQVEQLLQEGDYSLLVDQAASDDRALRIYANEFAVDLGSPRLIAPALAQIAALAPDAASKDDNIASLIGVVQGAAPRASPADKAAIANALRPLAGKIGPTSNPMLAALLAR